MIATPDIDRIIGCEAVDANNDKIGKITQVYIDSDTEQPTWASVKTGLFGTSETLIPLANASWDSDVLHVGVDKDRVKDAPRVDPDAEISPQEQERLYDYYGLSQGAGMGTTGSGMTTGTTGSGMTTGTDTGMDRTGTVGRDTSGPTTDDAMTRSEERLNVGTERVQTGKARLRKYVVTEQQSVTVPVTREEVRIEREPITDANRGAAMDGPNLSEEEHEVTLSEERPVVDKETVPVERVRLDKERVTENQQVSADVAREEIATEGDGVTDRTIRDDGSRL